MRTTLWIPLFLASMTLLSAQEPLTIDQQIEAIRKAAPQERVKLMNQFKQQLASMNAEERSKSISRLRTKIQGTQEHTASEQMNSEAQRDQMQQNEHLQRVEQMQQQHGGQQIHEMETEMGENLPVQPKKPYSNYP